MNKQKAIYLDRDGTLNFDPGYVHKLEDFKLLPGVIEGLQLLKEDYLFFIITNQSGIGKGLYSWSDFTIFQGRLITELVDNGIQIEKTYVCPHTPEDNCECRKPKTFNLDKSVRDYKIDLKNSWVIGDHPSDVALGINAGCRTIYLLTGHGRKHFDELETKKITPTFIAENFLTAAKHILSKSKN